jgi:hypothetical protein
MKLFKTDTAKHLEMLADEVVYARVATELDAGTLSVGLWAKALSNSGGNETVARAEYIKLRVSMYKSEVAARSEMTRNNKLANSSDKTQVNDSGKGWGTSDTMFISALLFCGFMLVLFALASR